MSIYELLDESLFESDGEGLDEAEPEADFSERRPRWMPPPVRPGPTSKARSYSPPRPTQNNVTQAQFQAAMERIRQDMQRNAEAIRKVSAQVTRINSQLAAASVRQDKEIVSLQKAVKEIKKQNQLAALLPLLTPAPTLTAANPAAEVHTAGDVAAAIKIPPPDMLLPLLLTIGGSSFGGSDNGDSLSPLVLLLALKK
jgi:hypothetical protein